MKCTFPTSPEKGTKEAKSDGFRSEGFHKRKLVVLFVLFISLNPASGLLNSRGFFGSTGFGVFAGKSTGRSSIQRDTGLNPSPTVQLLSCLINSAAKVVPPGTSYKDSANRVVSLLLCETLPLSKSIVILFVSSKARWARQHTAFSDQERGGSAQPTAE